MTTTTTAWTRSFVNGRAEYRTRMTVGDIEISLMGVMAGRKRTRVYVSGEPKVDFSEAERLSREAGSLVRGSSVEADKAWDAANRALVRSKKDFLEALVATIPALAEVLGDHKLHYNRKAGCSCGCSPGFVAAAALSIMATIPDWRDQPSEQPIRIWLEDVSAYKIKAKAA